ncbi:hypothetical protein Ddc_11943 [Ditylenchus destructor]|nr:hypothetical protein Ddc_11943 [Ditylenchus destructor]
MKVLLINLFVFLLISTSISYKRKVIVVEYDENGDATQPETFPDDDRRSQSSFDDTEPREQPLTRECTHSYSKFGSLIFDPRDPYIRTNRDKLLGMCPCSPSGITQHIFTAKHASPSENEEIEVTAECVDMRRFCMCTESGQCYTQSGNGLRSVAFTPFCDGGGCHFYALVNAESDAGLQGDQANIFRARDQLEADGSPRRPSSDSIYLKAKSVSCNGCSALQSVSCSGPFRDITLGRSNE